MPHQVNDARVQSPILSFACRRNVPALCRDRKDASPSPGTASIEVR
jgi:hypothetical protein